MKNQIQNLFTVLAVFAGIHQAAGQGTTAFTYQGQLRDNGTNANGAYTMIFALYDAVTNGDLIAGPVTNNATLANGLFTVNLDFGAGAFNGSARYLDITITNGGATQELSPRVQVLPSPYALMANSASNLLGTLPASQLPGSVLTNSASGVTLSGSFNGNGAGLTNLNVVIPSAINENAITIGGTNVVAPLTVQPRVPASAIGSISLDPLAYSIAVAGRYVYVGSFSSNVLQVIDVSNPTGPVLISSVGTGNDPTSIAVAGRYAYVASSSGTLQVFDVSNPSAPILAGSAGTGNYPNSVVVAGRYVYEVGNALQIFDVSNPSAPVLAGSVAAGGTSVAVSGRYAFVTSSGAYNVNTVQIVDVSNPASPVLAGSTSLANYFSPMSVTVVGRYAYVANIAGWLQIIDISNPANPVLVNSSNGFNCCGVPGVYVAVAGRSAFVLNEGADGGGSSLNIYDVSTPASPVLTGSLAMGGNPVTVAVFGRYAYVGFYSGTLQVFDLGGAYIQQFEAGAMETGTLQTRDTVNVGNNLNVRGGLTVGGSALISGGLNLGGITTNILTSSSGGHTLYITNGIIMNVQ